MARFGELCSCSCLPLLPNLPAAFTKPEDHLLAEPCTSSLPGAENKAIRRHPVPLPLSLCRLRRRASFRLAAFLLLSSVSVPPNGFSHGFRSVGMAKDGRLKERGNLLAIRRSEGSGVITSSSARACDGGLFRYALFLLRHALARPDLHLTVTAQKLLAS